MISKDKLSIRNAGIADIEALALLMTDLGYPTSVFNLWSVLSPHHLEVFVGCAVIKPTTG